MNRIKVKFKDIVTIKNGSTPSTSILEYYDGDIIWITPKDLSNQKKKYIHRGERTITQKGFDSCSATLVPKGTILMSSRAPIGLLSIANTELCTNQGFKNLVPDKTKIDSDFLYYYLKTKINDIEKLGSGTTFKEVSKSSLENFELLIPKEINDQQKIASVLSALDAKIELNNRINVELEAMAKTLYDYWFVQFDFPDKNGKPYKASGGKMVWNEELKRQIPEGWEVVPLFKAMDVQYGFPFGTSKFTDEITDKPVIRIRDILENTISTYTTEDVEEKYRLQQNDLLIGMDGNFHLNFWDKDGAYLNQRSVRIRTRKDSEISNLQAYFELKPHIKARENNVSRTTVAHLSDKDLKRLFLISPTPEEKFKPKELFDSILGKITSNRLQNQKLTKLRDWLLPMLMNGQVKVN
jgi:type I restriction enzyme S subunit